MRIRAQDANGDYTFGQSQGNFLINSPMGVAQNVLTTLLLQAGEWFLDTTVGVPYIPNILGYDTQGSYDATIKDTILSVEGVTAIISYQSAYSSSTRVLSVTAQILTEYSSEPVTVNF